MERWHKNITRSIKKENKLYFYDWSNVTEAGCRFENLLAASLIKMAVRLTEIGPGHLRSCIYGTRKNRKLISYW